MFNLIRRDLILQKYQLYVFIPFIIFFVVMNVPPALTFLVASIFIPFNAFGYDEKSESHILLNSLPYTRKEIIASRYIGAIVYMVLAIIITSIILFLFNKPFSLTHIAIGSGLFLLFVALTFPLYYIFKQGNLTIFILISFILVIWSVGPVVSFMVERFPSFVHFVTNLSSKTITLSATVIIVSFYVISWISTTSLYERKIF